MGGGSAATAGGDGGSAKATEGSAPVRGCYRCGREGHISTNLHGSETQGVTERARPSVPHDSSSSSNGKVVSVYVINYIQVSSNFGVSLFVTYGVGGICE